MLPTISGEFGVVADPQVRFGSDGSMWATIRGVAKERKNDGNGNWVDGEVCYMDIIVSRKLGENVVESISKGSTMTVTGTLHYREWEDNEGRKNKAYSIRATSLGVTPRFTPVRAVDQPVAKRVVNEVSEEAPF